MELYNSSLTYSFDHFFLFGKIFVLINTKNVHNSSSTTEMPHWRTIFCPPKKIGLLFRAVMETEQETHPVRDVREAKVPREVDFETVKARLVAGGRRQPEQ